MEINKGSLIIGSVILQKHCQRLAPSILHSHTHPWKFLQCSQNKDHLKWNSLPDCRQDYTHQNADPTFPSQDTDSVIIPSFTARILMIPTFALYKKSKGHSCYGMGNCPWNQNQGFCIQIFLSVSGSVQSARSMAATSCTTRFTTVHFTVFPIDCVEHFIFENINIISVVLQRY